MVVPRRPEAIRRYRGAVTETAGFGRTSGFIDDTRAFCSIPARHDMSRRLDCGYLAELVATHRLDEDEAWPPRTTWWPSTRRRRSSYDPNPATDPDRTRRLSRDHDGRPAAPVRIAHLGTGTFFRAHQAWYTEHAPDAAQWGIAAFSGRAFSGHGGRTAEALAGQDGLYTLVVRAADGDHPETVSALSEVSGSLDDWRRCFARPELALVTITVTEAGYRRTGDGGLDAADPEVAADVAALQNHGTDAEVVTAPGSSRSGSRCGARRACRAWPSCPATTCRTTGPWWRGSSGSWPPPSTPASPPGSRRTSRSSPRWSTASPRGPPTTTAPGCAPRPASTTRCRWSPSPTSSGCWPGTSRTAARAGRTPAPGSSTTSCRGSSASSGCSTGRTRSWPTPGRSADTTPSTRRSPTRSCGPGSTQWWDDAARHLPLPADEIAAYRAALLERYANPRIRHLLAQIAADGSQKLPIRILPTVRAELAEGRVPQGAVRVLAAWVCHLRGLGAPVADVAADEFVALASGDLDDAVGRVLDRLGVDDQQVRAAAAALAHELDR